MADKKNNLIWLDLEMTGLNPNRERIIEIATVVTDTDLNVIATGPELVINQPEKLLKDMDAWNTRQHTGSGLVEKVRQSTITENEAELRTLDFLVKYVEPGYSPMCGNSICQDRRFLSLYMPKLEAFFHYRHLDVSTVKILAKNWAPDIASKFSKESNHRALDDILGSIAELKYYREQLMKV
jgi:oligoribonuclease